MIGNEERLLRPMFGRRWRVLRADAEVVHASADLDLYRSTDAGATFHFVARAGETWRDRALARTPLVSRLLRCGFHGLTPLPNGDMVAVVRGAILHRAAGADRFEVAHRIERGSRPLNVGLAPSGRLFFGEYFGNPDRAEVHVYGSDDGRSWEVAHTFPAGSIRHVHGVHADPYRGGVWVLTGDDDQESGLYWSDDDLATLEPVVSGTQRARAVAVLPRPEAGIVPTDTPGFELIRNVSVMGHEGRGWASHGEVSYQSCRVPQANLLGPEGAGFTIAQKRLGPGRIHHCMRWLGIASRSFDLLCERANSRVIDLDGSTLADRQVVQHWVAESAAAIEGARLMTLHAAWQIDQVGSSAARDSIAAIKFTVANVMLDVVDKAIQVHGALGVTDDTILSYFLRHERAARIYDGADEVHKTSLGRRLLRSRREQPVG